MCIRDRRCWQTYQFGFILPHFIKAGISTEILVSVKRKLHCDIIFGETVRLCCNEYCICLMSVKSGGTLYSDNLFY